MIGGILTNFSVCWVVVRNSQARSPRTLFIINMAISDLMVCLITMPFTMQRFLNHIWPYGEALCRLTRYVWARRTLMLLLPFLAYFFSQTTWHNVKGDLTLPIRLSYNINANVRCCGCFCTSQRLYCYLKCAFYSKAIFGLFWRQKSLVTLFLSQGLNSIFLQNIWKTKALKNDRNA